MSIEKFGLQLAITKVGNDLKSVGGKEEKEKKEDKAPVHDENYLYFSCIALHGDVCNGNGDMFPWTEISPVASSFIGKPVNINHDRKRKVGELIEAFPVENGDDRYIIVIGKISRKEFPEICQKMDDGKIVAVSMEASVLEAECPVCKTKAHDLKEFCDHLKSLNGETEVEGKMMKHISINHGVSFAGLALMDAILPADPDADVLKVAMEKDKRKREEEAARLVREIDRAKDADEILAKISALDYLILRDKIEADQQKKGKLELKSIDYQKIWDANKEKLLQHIKDSMAKDKEGVEKVITENVLISGWTAGDSRRLMDIGWAEIGRAMSIEEVVPEGPAIVEEPAGTPAEGEPASIEEPVAGASLKVDPKLIEKKESKELAQALHGAEIVVHNDEQGLIYAWFGGESTMVHIYNEDGKELDVWTLGDTDPETGKVTKQQVEESIKRHMNEKQESLKAIPVLVGKNARWIVVDKEMKVLATYLLSDLKEENKDKKEFGIKVLEMYKKGLEKKAKQVIDISMAVEVPESEWGLGGVQVREKIDKIMPKGWKIVDFKTEFRGKESKFSIKSKEATPEIKKRLEELRKAIENENISYGEIAELQGLAEYIEPGDVLLLEWAGVPEFPESEMEARLKELYAKKEPDPSLKPPKEWWDKMEKRVKKGNPDYSAEQVAQTIGKIWSDLSDAKKKEIRGREGKTFGPAKKKSILDIKSKFFGDLPDEIKEAIWDGMENDPEVSNSAEAAGYFSREDDASKIETAIGDYIDYQINVNNTHEWIAEQVNKYYLKTPKAWLDIMKSEAKKRFSDKKDEEIEKMVGDIWSKYSKEDKVKVIGRFEKKEKILPESPFKVGDQVEDVDGDIGKVVDVTLDTVTDKIKVYVDFGDNVPLPYIPEDLKMASLSSKASTFDKMEQVEIGEGYIAKKDKEKKTITVVDKDGKEVKTLPDGFGDDIASVISLIRDILGLKDRPKAEHPKKDKTPAKPKENEVPDGAGEGKPKDEPKKEESLKEKPIVKTTEELKKEADEKVSKDKAELEAKLKADMEKAASLKRESELKQKEEELKREKENLAKKKTQDALEAKHTRCKKIVDSMCEKGMLTVDKAAILSETGKGKDYFDAEKSLFIKLKESKVSELLALEDKALDVLEAGVKSVVIRRDSARIKAPLHILPEKVEKKGAWDLVFDRISTARKYQNQEEE